MAQHLLAEGGAELADNIWTSYSTRDRTLLTIGSVAAFAFFWLVAGMFGFPQMRGYDASLLMQPKGILLLIGFGIVFVAATAVTGFFTNVVHFEAGLFCASVGLVALSTRGGPMRYVLIDSPGSSGVFIKLLIELVLLFAVVLAGWMLLLRLRDLGLLRGEPHGEDDPDDATSQGLLALATQVVLMLVLMLLLAQTDVKAQAIWSVALSAYLAALGAHQVFPSRPSFWYWTTPLIVGAIGYILASMGGNNLPAGEVGGIAPALARPLPLDYASVGVAGSLYGYWTSRHWEHEQNEAPEDPEGVEDALEHPKGNA